MNENEIDFKEIGFKEKFDLNLQEFYKALTKAIQTNNMQSLYNLSKIFTRYCFKELDN
jgi:hypothetical protein